MSPENLIQWLRAPALLNRDSLLQLRSLLDEYPCFTIARVLYLKNLLQLHDLHFSKELIRTAISVPDRRRLYYFIEGKTMPEPVYTAETEMATGGGFSIIDRFLNEKGVDLSSTDLLITIPSEYENQSNDALKFNMNLPEDMIVDKKEGESFSLDYITYLKHHESLSAPEELFEPMPGQNLIDAFLDSATLGDNNLFKNEVSDVEVSEKQVVEVSDHDHLTEQLESLPDLPEDTFTETLAKIYLKQKRYDRALEIFKSLSLKYPEKNVYFADQIRFLEKLIINIKNN